MPKNLEQKPAATAATSASNPPSWQVMDVSLPYSPPLDWQSLLAHFASHQIHGVEKVGSDAYERVFRVGGVYGRLRVSHHPGAPELLLHVQVEDAKILPSVTSKIRVMFDLDSDYAAAMKSLGGNSIFREMVKTYPGLRVARSWDPFEEAISTILGQLVSVKRGRDMVGDLVAKQGELVMQPALGEGIYLFPSAEKLATADLTHLGTTQIRKKTIKLLSQMVAQKQIDLAGADTEALKKNLLTVPGIGPWSVEYIALRALGGSDAFPGTDLILKRALENYPGLRINNLRPWRSYAAIYLWKDYVRRVAAHKAGAITEKNHDPFL